MILAVYPVFFACYTVNEMQKQGLYSSLKIEEYRKLKD
jgi:hypothetical protein